jgi:hypothetical protein
VKIERKMVMPIERWVPSEPVAPLPPDGAGGGADAGSGAGEFSGGGGGMSVMATT